MIETRAKLPCAEQQAVPRLLIKYTGQCSRGAFSPRQLYALSQSRARQTCFAGPGVRGLDTKRVILRATAALFVLKCTLC